MNITIYFLTSYNLYCELYPAWNISHEGCWEIDDKDAAGTHEILTRKKLFVLLKLPIARSFSIE